MSALSHTETEYKLQTKQEETATGSIYGEQPDQRKLIVRKENPQQYVPYELGFCRVRQRRQLSSAESLSLSSWPRQHSTALYYTSGVNRMPQNVRRQIVQGRLDQLLRAHQINLLLLTRTDAHVY